MGKGLGIATLFLASVGLVHPGLVAAQTRGKTVAGSTYVTGGVTVAELRKLDGEKDNYSLWITTAAKESGAYLSDVKLKITGAKKQVVLDTTMIGPWLMVDLPAGKYTVEAGFKDQTQKRTTHIRAGEHEQMIMYFESPAEVSPDWVSPFKDSPYSGK